MSIRAVMFADWTCQLYWLLSWLSSIQIHKLSIQLYFDSMWESFKQVACIAAVYSYYAYLSCTDYANEQKKRIRDIFTHLLKKWHIFTIFHCGILDHLNKYYYIIISFSNQWDTHASFSFSVLSSSVPEQLDNHFQSLSFSVVHTIEGLISLFTNSMN